MRKLTFRAMLFAALSWSSLATTIYGNLPVGGILTATDSTYPSALATVFTATNSGILGQVLVPVSNTLPLTFGLYADSGGQPAAIPLESWSNISVSTVPTAALTTLPSVVHPSLSAGSVYWFTATDPGNDASGEQSWGLSSVVATGGIWAEVNGSPFTQSAPGSAPPAIELDSTPEPGTWLLLGLGLSGFGAARLLNFRPALYPRGRLPGFAKELGPLAGPSILPRNAPAVCQEPTDETRVSRSVI